MKQTDNFSRFMVIGITSIVALVVVAVLVISNRPRETSSEHLALLLEMNRGITADTGLPYIGEEDAPVTMTIYEDMGCPNCQNFYANVEQDIIEDFVADGQVRIVVYQLAFVNNQSLPSAEATACALEQNAFWEYRDIVFNNQGIRQFSRENLIAFAEELDLDVDAFSECFDLGVHTPAIIQRTQTAYDFGVTGTPTVEVAGVRYVGVTPYERTDPPGMRLILEAALNQ